MSSTLTAIQKRDALHSKSQKTGTAENKIKIGEALEAEDWLSDAIDFFGKAEASDKLLSVQKKASDEGNVFLFLKAQRLISDEIPSEALIECTKKAEQNGMTRYAMLGYETLGDEENLQRLRESVKDDGDIVLEDSADVFIPETTEE